MGVITSSPGLQRQRLLREESQGRATAPSLFHGRKLCPLPLLAKPGERPKNEPANPFKEQQDMNSTKCLLSQASVALTVSSLMYLIYGPEETMSRVFAVQNLLA